MLSLNQCVLDAVPPSVDLSAYGFLLVLSVSLIVGVLLKLLLASSILSFFIVYEGLFFNIVVFLLYSFGGFNMTYILVLYLLVLSSIELIVFLTLLLI
jgi:hypothetical protein